MLWFFLYINSPFAVCKLSNWAITFSFFIDNSYTIVEFSAHKRKRIVFHLFLSDSILQPVCYLSLCYATKCLFSWFCCLVLILVSQICRFFCSNWYLIWKLWVFYELSEMGFAWIVQFDEIWMEMCFFLLFIWNGFCLK